MVDVKVLVLERGLIDSRNEGPRYKKSEGRIGMSDNEVGWMK